MTEKIMAIILATTISNTSGYIEEHIKTELNEQKAMYEQQLKDEEERLYYEEYLRQNPEFPTYDLSVEELSGIARLCQQEQGTLEGSAAEASLMANRYELYGQNNYNSIYNYVRNCGWFYNSAYYMSLTSSLDPEIYDIVKQVLMDGKRTLPKYVDEHDYIGDINFITTGNKWQQSDYIPFETMIYNGHGSYGFYDFPGGSDPFGYTSNELRSELGEDHYEFSRLLQK